MRRQILTACCVLSIAAAVGCTSEESEDKTSGVYDREIKKATAWLNPSSDSELVGSAIFIKEGGQIALQVSVEQAPPGEHAVRIHESGDCSSPDGKSAGGHWNPAGATPSGEGGVPVALGDIGTVSVGEDGTGTLTLTTDRWSMGTGEENDILEKAVIVHAAADESAAQPAGSEGARIGCGVIRAQ